VDRIQFMGKVFDTSYPKDVRRSGYQWLFGFQASTGVAGVGITNFLLNKKETNPISMFCFENILGMNQLQAKMSSPCAIIGLDIVRKTILLKRSGKQGY